MHRLAPRISIVGAVLAAALVGVLAPARAHAQITYTYQTYGGRGAPSSGATNYLVNWPISQEECEANAPISMVITNAPYDGTGLTRLVWDLWQGGTGTSGANCQTATNRRATGGSAAVCTNRTGWPGGEITTTMPTLEFRPQELFPDGCSGSSQGTYIFYLLAVSARGDSTTDIATTAFFTFSIALDFQAPEAPVLEDAAGDRAIVVGWTNEATETLSGANVYVDTSAPCGASTVLVAGSAAPTTLDPAVVVSGSAPTSAELDGQALGLAVGESASIAVTVLDLARNESVLSNVACIERVPVAGFWDAYCSERGLSAAECQSRYSGCSVSQGAGPVSRTWLFGLLVVGLAIASRRRFGGAR